jgi:hypothetical protein
MSVLVRSQISKNSNKDQSHTAVATVSLKRAARRGNRIATAFAILPVLLLVGVGISAQASRAIKQQVERTKYGFSSGEAMQVASAVCTQVLGKTAKAVVATSQTAYSKRRGTTVREWTVVCSTPEGQYILRINSDTHQVYAINRVSDGTIDPVSGLEMVNALPPSVGAATEEDIVTGEAETKMSRREAEANARRYLSLLGVPSKRIEPVSDETSYGVTGSPLWNFTYQTQKGPEDSKHTLKVSINGGDGKLENVWNPSSLR